MSRRGLCFWVTLSVASALPLGASVAAADAGATDGAARPAGMLSARVSERTRARCDRARGRAKRRGRTARRPRVSEAYRRQVAFWHKPASARQVKAWLRDAPPLLVLRPIAKGEPVSIRPSPATGEFSELAVSDAAAALRHRDSGETMAVHPRLVEILYRAVKFFRAPYVWVVSGFRPTRATSRHAQGRAIDIILPGVPNARLAKFLRKQGFVGVGVYPVSGFVHLDVRAQSYFWVDASAPGEAQRARPVERALARREDRLARRRGELPTPDAELDSGAEPQDESIPSEVEAAARSGASEAE